MRPVVIAANWKMNTTPNEAAALAAAIAAATEETEVTRVICPPSVALAAVRDALEGTGVAVGAQNIHAESFGAFTGEVSAPMLRGLASWCIVGHSERRRDQCETDELVGRKLLRCREAGIRPILCVGENLPEREMGMAEAVVAGQLRSALVVLSAEPAPPITDLVVAYEPVWAIGTGRTARGADAAQMAQIIRDGLAEGGWGDAAKDVPVLYGGSVTSVSVAEFLAEPALDGALVGGASLRVEEMAGIVTRAALTARGRVWAADRS